MAAKSEEALPLVRERRTHDRRASVPVKWTYERWILTLGFAGTILGMTFGLGVNWAKTTEVRAIVEANAAVAVRKDVYNADQERVAQSIDRQAESIDRLSRAVEQLDERLRQQSRTPVFGRQ